MAYHAPRIHRRLRTWGAVLFPDIPFLRRYEAPGQEVGRRTVPGIDGIGSPR